MSDAKRDSRTPDLPSWARWHPEGLVLALHVRAGARKTTIRGEYGERLSLALHAPPVDGKANEELLRFLAKELALPRVRLRLLYGQTSRDKAVIIQSDETEARRALAQLAVRANIAP